MSTEGNEQDQLIVFQERMKEVISQSPENLDLQKVNVKKLTDKEKALFMGVDLVKNGTMRPELFKGMHLANLEELERLYQREEISKEAYESRLHFTAWLGNQAQKYFHVENGERE